MTQFKGERPCELDCDRYTKNSLLDFVAVEGIWFGAVQT